ncbi:methyltransferase domain-containing protein [Candidatus Poribacteria bacterium]|nr:methyltransferase domain-containing protein [Candidatus Poribacteria bacterium]
MPVILKPKREKPVIQNHPWIFSGAIDEISGEPEDGDIIDVLDNKGTFLARGYINRKSQIIVRVMTRNADEIIDREFFAKRIRNAIDYRHKVLSLENYTAYRMVHDASDMLPGLIVDKYGDYLVVQILTLGMDVRKDIIAETLQDLLKPKGIYERSDSRIRLKEGLQQYKGILRGQEPPDEVEIKQNGARFLVNFKEGQKTGKFLDQRENIQITGSYAREREILDCFCYTGSFTVWCGLKGAKKITGLDISKNALATARRNIKINDIKDKCQLIQGDVFHVLETCRRKFDMIILDPPGFAKSKRAVKGAARGYKYINMAAMKLLNPGGILVTFSCSHHVNLDLFRKIVFGASVDAECNLRIIRTLQAAPDHPINISHPESEYLKGLICQIM